jgi:hypothetical protein
MDHIPIQEPHNMEMFLGCVSMCLYACVFDLCMCVGLCVCVCMYVCLILLDRLLCHAERCCVHSLARKPLVCGVGVPPSLSVPFLVAAQINK